MKRATNPFGECTLKVYKNIILTINILINICFKHREHSDNDVLFFALILFLAYVVI